MMEFVRKKKRGVNKKTCRMWRSAEGYRIVWRKEVFGVAVAARYQACVQVILPNFAGRLGEFGQMWDLVSRPLFKTMKAAEDACETHRRQWAKACEATGIRGLLEIFEKLPVGFPRWVQQQMNPKVLAILLAPRTSTYAEDDECPDHNDLTKTSPTSAAHTEPPLKLPTPVSPVTDLAGSTAKREAAATPSTATPVARPDKAPRPPADKRTAKRSGPSVRKRKSTSTATKSASKLSKSSRPKKSKS
jgi:hypothetical protein